MPCWFVAYTKPHREEFAQIQLLLKGLQVFFPRLLLPESARKHKRLVPLFPNYLFVRIRAAEEFQYVTWSPGISRLVSFNGVPAALDNEIVLFLMKQASPEGIIMARSSLKEGQQVQISGGPFDGLMGIIQEPPDAKGRVKILLSLLSRQVKVELPICSIRSEWVL